MEMDTLYSECTMGDLLLRCIDRGGNRTAFISGGISTSYQAFGRLVSQMVQVFDQHRIGRGDGVACLTANSMESFLVMAASYVAGVRVTNLHPLASADDQAFILGDSTASCLFFDPATHGDRAAALGKSVPSLQLLSLGPCGFAVDALAEAESFAPSPLVSRAETTDLCWLLYTGGTTGRPKGVMHSHRTHVAMVMAQLAEWELPEPLTFLAITPISHGAGACLMPILLRSGTIVMENGFSPQHFFEVTQLYAVTATFLVPTMIYRLIDYAATHDVSAPSLALIIYGAAPMAPSRLREGLLRFGSIFMQLYAQSEAPLCVSVLRKQDHVTDDERRLGSCGRPIFTSQVVLLDQSGKVVEPGDVGEVCVRGPLVMEGYWNRPEETAHAFRHGWLHTGDLARQDPDGLLYIVGRSKDMIISGGFNVYPTEIEDLLSTHPAVSSSAVIGLPDPNWGEAVAAIVVLRAGHSIGEAELTSWVKQAKGSVYTPKRVFFVDEIPLTSLGKPDKRALREQYSPAAPETATLQLS
jgi:fatty-acyl-CoA synthase